MYPCDPISFNYMKIRGEASYYYAEIKEFVKDLLYAYWLCWLHFDVFSFSKLKVETINVASYLDHQAKQHKCFPGPQQVEG